MLHSNKLIHMTCSVTGVVYLVQVCTLRVLSCYFHHWGYVL